jgi:hypothetical protein
MTTYREIYGRRVEVVSADPGNLKAGQIWYNSASGTVKSYVLAPGSIAAGGNPGGNGGKTQLGGCGTVTAGLIFGGEPTTTATEEYDGTSWTNVNAAPTGGTDMGSAGNQTAALWVGGTGTLGSSYEYDGTNWSSGGGLGTSMRFAVGTCGTQTAAMLTGGYQTPPGTPSAIMQSYDGSSWTTIPQTYPTSADTPAFRTSGTQTAIISAGGNSQATTSLDWDGSSWTANNPLAVGVSAQVQQGTQTASLVATGHPAPSGGYSTKLQEYDGTNWSLSPATFSTGRSQAAGGGTTASMFVANGAPSVDATEVYTGPALATKTLTTE